MNVRQNFINFAKIRENNLGKGDKSTNFANSQHNLRLYDIHETWKKKTNRKKENWNSPKEVERKKDTDRRNENFSLYSSSLLISLRHSSSPFFLSANLFYLSCNFQLMYNIIQHITIINRVSLSWVKIIKLVEYRCENLKENSVTDCRLKCNYSFPVLDQHN